MNCLYGKTSRAEGAAAVFPPIVNMCVYIKCKWFKIYSEYIHIPNELKRFGPNVVVVFSVVVVPICENIVRFLFISRDYCVVPCLKTSLLYCQHKTGNHFLKYTRAVHLNVTVNFYFVNTNNGLNFWRLCILSL